MALILSLVACGTERGVRPAEAEVSYGGWVYDGAPSDGVVLGEGALTFAVEGEVFEAEQLYEDYPGYWLATVPTGAPFELRVEGADAYPSVWAGDTPGADGTWHAGALFSARKDYVDALLASLDLPTGVVPTALARGGIHLWGYPSDGSDWDCAGVTIAGEPVVCFAVGDDGALGRVSEGPFDYFFAFNLAPGEIVLDDGFGGGETWTATEGDLVMAFWLEHG